MVINNNPVLVSDEESKMATIRETLGIMPYLGKLVICVEGEHDIKFLKNINANIPELKAIFDIESKNVNIIPLNGGNLKNWVDRNYLRGSNVIEFHIYDRDSNSGKNSEQYKQSCDEVNSRPDRSFALLTQKRELENYMHPSLLQSEFDLDFTSIADWDTHDVPDFIAQKKGIKPNDVKSIINGKLARNLTKQHLVQLNAYAEIEGWFMKMNELYE